MNPFEFCGNNSTNSLSILMIVAASILTVLGEQITRKKDFQMFSLLDSTT